MVHKYYVLITSQCQNHLRLKMRFTSRPEKWGGIIQTSFNGGRKIKALQSYRIELGNDFVYSSPKVHFQSNSYRLSLRSPPAKQLSSERAPLKQQNKVTLTAEIKPISKQRVITQMCISRVFLFSDLVRLESLYTPHTLTHPRTLTRARSHTRGSSGERRQWEKQPPHLVLE